ncbi:hypothetical protein ABGT15_00170 [Flavobacterium enshiense]|uniref:hypothetical protein n=1 Tax=Flavobacterium enshiense TaxID=1341165 RepID=UPI00345C8113
MNVLLSLVLSFFFCLTQDLSDVRSQYYAASKSRQAADKFYDSMESYNRDNKTLLAYKGAALTLKSKFASDKKIRKESFTEGVMLLENCVKKEPKNAEIRLIRLSIQENTPKFLKYKANIEEDKKMILASFDKEPKELQNYIRTYVQQSKVFTDTEKQKLK